MCIQGQALRHIWPLAQPQPPPPSPGLTSVQLPLFSLLQHAGLPRPSVYSSCTLCCGAFAYTVPSHWHASLFSLLSEPMKTSSHLSSQQKSQPLPPRNVPCSPNQLISPRPGVPGPVYFHLIGSTQPGGAVTFLSDNACLSQ